jgi:hypothetical protein
MNFSICAMFDLSKETKNTDSILTYLLKDISYYYNQEKNQYYAEITYIKDYNVATDPTDYIETLYCDNTPSYQDIIDFFLKCAKDDFEIYKKNPQLFQDEIERL